MRKRVTLLGILIAVCFLLGCKTIEEKWTEDKGFTYISNYSTLDPLGYIVKENVLKSNPLFAVTAIKGKIHDETRSQEDQFELKGSAEVEKLLKQISDGKLEGDFSRVSKANIQLINPFHEMANCFIPTAPCDQRQIEVVTSVINVGDIEVQVEGNNGANITSSFKISPAAAGAVSAGISTGSVIKRSGSGYYTGYQSKVIQCVAEPVTKIRLERGQQVIDNDTGLSVVYLDDRIDPPFHEVLVHIIPSKFDRSLSFDEVHAQYNTREWLDNLTPEQREKMWEKALKPTQQGGAISIKNPEFIVLQFGSQFGLPIVPSESGIYIETGAINDEIVELNAQRVQYVEINR